MLRKNLAIILAVCIILCMCSCGKEPQTPQATPDTESTDSADTESPKYDDYITLNSVDTGFGLITVPEFSTTALDQTDAENANELFADIKDKLLENIEEFKKTSGDESSVDKNAPPICVTKAAVNGRILSVYAKYFYYFSYPYDYFEAINFDIETGKAIDPDDVIEAAGFTLSEVKAAIRCVAERDMFLQWQWNAYFEAASSNESVDGLTAPHDQWQGMLDDIERDYDMESQPLGDVRDSLPLYPTVFYDDSGSLYVSANIPQILALDTNTKMVCIGHNDSETLVRNPLDGSYPYKHSAISEDDAIDSVCSIIGAQNVENNGYKMMIEHMTLVEDSDGKNLPSYYIRVFTDQETHISTVDYYAVSAFSNTVWKMDITSGNWNICN